MELEEPKIIIPSIEIVLPERKNSKTGGPSWESYRLIPITREQRGFWPPYKIDFYLRTDIGAIITRVVGDSGKVGDPYVGSYITKEMHPWFLAHPELKAGSILEARKLEDLLYSIDILRIA